MSRKPTLGQLKAPSKRAIEAFRRPNGADVAQLAGVSQSAVSRALRPGGSASAQVRAKVAAAAEKLGYRPNHLARAMTTRQTSVIAVVMSGATTVYYPEVLRELCHAIAAQGCRAMVFMADGPGDQAAAVDAMASYRIDAAITLVSLAAEHLKLLQRHEIHVVFYNREGLNNGRNAVTCDHRASGRDAALHLLELGHRRCAIVAGPDGSWVSSERIAGIVSARSSDGAGLSILASVRGDYSYDSGRDAVHAVMTGVDAITALIACNDAMAAAAVDVLRQHYGRSVPDDVSVVGFDGTEFGNWDAYRLTTVRQPLARLCAAAVEMLTAENAFDEGERRVFNAVLIPGATTGPAGQSFRAA